MYLYGVKHALLHEADYDKAKFFLEKEVSHIETMNPWLQ